MWYSSLREYCADARFYLVSPMCDIYLERYIGVLCTGLYVKLEVLWEVHFPLAYTLTMTLRLKNQVLSAWLQKSEATWTKEKERTTRPRRVSVLWAGAAWCSRLGLSLILLLKAVPTWGLSTMRANRCRCVPSTLQQPLYSRAQFATEPVYSVLFVKHNSFICAPYYSFIYVTQWMLIFNWIHCEKIS